MIRYITNRERYEKEIKKQLKNRELLVLKFISFRKVYKGWFITILKWVKIKCQFTAKKIVNGKEIIYECQEEAVALNRTLDVCSKHFYKLRQDNMKRVWEDGLNNPDEEDNISYDNTVENENDTFIPNDCTLIIKDKRLFGGMVERSKN